MTLHSPSIEPGHTPYVRDEPELQVFLGRIEAFLEYFFGAMGGQTTTPEAHRLQLQAQDPLTPTAAKV